MQDDPLILLLLIAVSAYVAKMWFDDYRAAKSGKPNARALPGAVPVRSRAITIAVVGALVLLAFETVGEYALGISAQQSTITGLFAFYTLLAAIVEEIIFRGFIVIDKRGRSALWTSILVASFLFAVLHPFLWKWHGGFPLFGQEPGYIEWRFDAKGWFSTACVFVGSLWFYAMRFALPMCNPARSLVPCFAAHAAKNLGVIAIKAATGYIAGWW